MYYLHSLISNFDAPYSDIFISQNAFSEKLQQFGANFYEMFVPDQLHEFEIGVWKATFAHAIRILYAAGGDKVQELNERFRQIPTFGRDTIRRFTGNMADMKKLGARDFEDLLQCSIPVFENLLPEPFNTVMMDLLWDLATWHGLAKLRMHTTSTLTHLDHATTALGKSLRQFKERVCSHYVTKELPRETAARGRRTAALAAQSQVARGNRGGRGGTRGRGRGRGRGGAGSAVDDQQPAEPSSTAHTGSTNFSAVESLSQPQVVNSVAHTRAAKEPRMKVFNLSTYKLHALGDYVSAIKQFGTSDNYSTQTVSLSFIRTSVDYD